MPENLNLEVRKKVEMTMADAFRTSTASAFYWKKTEYRISSRKLRHVISVAEVALGALTSIAFSYSNPTVTISIAFSCSRSSFLST